MDIHTAIERLTDICRSGDFPVFVGTSRGPEPISCIREGVITRLTTLSLMRELIYAERKHWPFEVSWGEDSFEVGRIILDGGEVFLLDELP